VKSPDLQLCSRAIHLCHLVMVRRGEKLRQSGRPHKNDLSHSGTRKNTHQSTPISGHTLAQAAPAVNFRAHKPTRARHGPSSR